MRFGILGEAAAWHADGSPVPLQRPKVRALLSLLALDAGQVVSSERLIEGVYAGAPPERVVNALQAQVSRLRRQLAAEDDLVEFHGSGYRLAVAPDSVDAYEFELEAGRAQQSLQSGDPEGASALLTDALELWRGPPLADLGDSPLIRGRVARLEELRLSATETLAEAEITRGDAATAIPRLRGLVATHPLRESLWCHLVRALADSGRRADALAAFEEARELLAEELGTDPSPELTGVHLAVLREEPEPEVPSRIRRLPAQLTRLVGREDELDRLAVLLSDARLVSLTGAGGAGKTRLAVEAAQRSELETCFVELAPVADLAEVPTTVSSALGLRPSETAEETVERLTKVLNHRPTRLLLDNCEHVAGAVANLTARLLADCPTLQVLVTSREPLEITGEYLFSVSTFDVPPRESDPEAALEYAAVRLFVDRVAMGDPEFTIDARNCADIVEVCRALDGMPLAIELAAARARTLPLSEIAARLDDPFTLLSRGDRTKDARHRTLRAVIEWSWGLLDDAERDLACRLSVFTDGATVHAAREVCGFPDTEGLLATLVDKSLLGLRDGRYRMLETIRAFAAERLADAAEHWRRRHATYFRWLAQDADPGLRRADQLDWLAVLDADYANLRSALRWATAADITLALQLTSALATYWWMRSRRHEGAMLCRTVAEEVGHEPPDGFAEEYLMAVFTAVAEIAEPEPLRHHLDTVNQIVRDLSQPPRQPMLTVTWARLSGPSGTTALTPPTTELLDSDPWSRALHPLSDGLQQLHTGRAEDAERSLVTALERFRAIGERWGMMKTLAEASRYPSWRGDHPRAFGMLDEAVELAGQLEATEETAELLWRRAEYGIRAGDHDRAHADATRALDLASDTGVLQQTARARATLAEIARLRGDQESARALGQRALEECPSGWVRPSEARMYVLVVLGRIATDDARTEDALAYLLEVVADGDALTSSAAAEGLAAIAADQGDGVRAAQLLGAAVALRGVTVAPDPDVSQVADTARTMIGSARFTAAHTSSQQMSREEVLTRTAEEWSAVGQ